MTRLRSIKHTMPSRLPALRRPMTRARITGPSMDLAKFFCAAFVLSGENYDDSYFDFNAILPAPEDCRSIWRGTNLRFQEMGFNTLGITFRTAWNGVGPVFEKMRELYPNLTVDLKWAAPSTGEAGIWHYGPDGVVGTDCQLDDDIANYVLDPEEKYLILKKPKTG